MINKIKQFFGYYSVKSLQGTSESILNVFNKTAVKLSLVNAQIDTEVANRDEAISNLQADQARLNNIKSANSKVIDKINSFLS